MRENNSYFLFIIIKSDFWGYFWREFIVIFVLVFVNVKFVVFLDCFNYNVVYRFDNVLVGS